MGKKYFIDLLEYVRIRVVIELKKNKVANLVVQLEILLEDWVPVVRYNYAHSFPHRDLLFADGGKHKEELTERNLNHILSAAIKDLKANWAVYLRRCGYEKEIEGLG